MKSEASQANLKQRGLIVRVDRFRISDGPGIRTAVFLKGCPLRCKWCSNPETQLPEPELGYEESLCIRECVECLKVCQVGAIVKREDGKIIINRDKCNKCFKCVKVCPTGALMQLGREVSVGEVLKEIERDLPFYWATGGGITITGGEPLFQPDFTRDLLRACKERGIHTVLDTSGFGTWNYFKAIIKYTDIILYDIKHADPLKHRELTGVDNKLILENLTKLKQEGAPIVVRIPVIPTLNDSKSDLAKLAELLNKLSIDYVELLPYHRLGVPKYKMLGRRYELDHLKPPTRDYMMRIKEFLERYGINAKIIV